MTTDPYDRLRNTNKTSMLAGLTGEKPEPVAPDGRAALSMAGIDLTEPGVRGRISAIARGGRHGAPKSRTQRAAERLDGTGSATSLPERPDMPFRRLGDFASSPRTARDLTASEIALLNLLGQRRDKLTEAEAAQVHQLGQHTGEGSADRALVDYVIEPAAARQKAEIDAAQLDYERARLAALPPTLPALPADVWSAMVDDLTDHIRHETPGLTEAEARNRATDALDEKRHAAEAEYAAKRGTIEATVAQLTQTVTSSPPVPTTPPPHSAPAPANVTPIRQPRQFATDDEAIGVAQAIAAGASPAKLADTDVELPGGRFLSAERSAILADALAHLGYSGADTGDDAA